MSKEYYKKRLIDLRASIAKEREAKKKDNAYYADMIKGHLPYQARQAIVNQR